MLQDEAAALLSSPIFLDKHVLCINKPAGMLSQPDVSGAPCASAIGSAFLNGGRASTVHRLDKRATGCLLLARSKRSASRLAAAFAASAVTKSYLVAVNVQQRLQDGETGLLRAAMRVKKVGREHGRVLVSELDEQSAALPGTRAAVLKWRALAFERGLAVLSVSPRGGHKHQVRAQLSFAGMPLVGDELYGSAPASSGGAPFLALHAATLQLDHPIGGHAPLRLRGELPSAWAALLPEGLVAAARHALSEGEVGVGPLWDEQPDAPTIL